VHVRAHGASVILPSQIVLNLEMQPFVGEIEAAAEPEAFVNGLGRQGHFPAEVVLKQRLEKILGKVNHART
jgi:hypothetical protein